MSEHGSLNGAEWLARARAGAGTSHVFFVESVLRRTLLQLKDLGVTPVLAHTEKAAAYMADGYARIAGVPGVCMAPGGRRRQPCFGTAGPVSRTHPGRRSDRAQAAGVPAPQCLSGDLHAPLFAAVTKFSTTVDLTSELPRLLRHAWRALPWRTRRARPISIFRATREMRSNWAKLPNPRSSTPRNGVSRRIAP